MQGRVGRRRKRLASRSRHRINLHIQTTLPLYPVLTRNSRKEIDHALRLGLGGPAKAPANATSGTENPIGWPLA